MKNAQSPQKAYNFDLSIKPQRPNCTDSKQRQEAASEQRVVVVTSM